MKEFILVYDDEEYSLLTMKELKDLLKKEMKNYILENLKELEKVTIDNELDDLLMIENCTNLATLKRLSDSFGYTLYSLSELKEHLMVVSNYLYNNTLEKDMFNRVEKVKNDISFIMNNLKF